MSKKKKIIISIGILLIIILSFIGGQTFAKYVAEVKGNGMAEVATWNFNVNGQTKEVQTINLGSTCNNETLLDNKIAPGTNGSFNIVVDATGSEVGIEYKIKFLSENNKPNNLKFIYQNVEYDSITDLEDNLSGVINANDENKTKTLTINWEWKYETGNSQEEIYNNDVLDTQDAQNIANYTFDVAVSGNQVLPQK